MGLNIQSRWSAVQVCFSCPGPKSNYHSWGRRLYHCDCSDSGAMEMHFTEFPLTIFHCQQQKKLKDPSTPLHYPKHYPTRFTLFSLHTLIKWVMCATRAASRRIYSLPSLDGSDECVGQSCCTVTPAAPHAQESTESQIHRDSKNRAERGVLEALWFL